MDRASLQRALEALEPQAREAEARVVRLEQESRTARDESQRLNLIVENLRSLAGVPLAEAKDADRSPAVIELQPAEVTLEPVPLKLMPQPVRPRQPSATQLVAEVVTTEGKPMSREAVFRVLERRGLTAGMSKPSNNVNVALRRAATQGLLRFLPDGTYAPSGWKELLDDRETGGREQGQLVQIGGESDG